MRAVKNKRNKESARGSSWEAFAAHLHPDVVKSIWVIALLGAAVLFILAGLGQAGPAGARFFVFLGRLFGWGYWLLPLASFLLAFSFLSSERTRFWGVTAIGSALFVLAGLGFLDIVAPDRGGLTGSLVGALEAPFGVAGSLVIVGFTFLVSLLIVLNSPLHITKLFQPRRIPQGLPPLEKPELVRSDHDGTQAPIADASHVSVSAVAAKVEQQEEKKEKKTSAPKSVPLGDYTPPPLSLLITSLEKPTVGDLRANANIMKRTLESFGISVEMGEINVGPTVTRYTLKPAEGIKLSRITALHQDLALALAAHPIRIEAPIPGKSLVGVEVPNKSAAVVRLGTLISHADFQRAGQLGFSLGRNLNGEPVFPNIVKMPHLLIAGSTGSGKSILIHSLLISLLYRNSPATLRLVLVDPKRVELSPYEGIPHLASPVITENKKALGVLRWAIEEMERRYALFVDAGARDVESYNKGGEKLPYLVMVIDELADIMASFGREVESTIIRLAQMSRATGIHLVVSTQRPSVEVITGLIKANITSRVALQVASQVDSRTILDTAGAEKLLGHGDLLFISGELSKPRRIQGAYISEDEIKKVVSFIKERNKTMAQAEESLDVSHGASPLSFDALSEDAGSDDDELYEEAVNAIRAAKKASASLLQRRLKIGYARAARLLDIMEERGVVGTGEGAKPREVYL